MFSKLLEGLRWVVSKILPIALGQYSSVPTDTFSIVLGIGSKVKAPGGIVLGTFSNVGAESSIAIGSNIDNNNCP